jgi:hypothetical protein
VSTRLRRWRWALAVLAVAVLAFAAERAMETPVLIRYLRVTSPTALVVGVVGGNGSWTRVTSVEETASAVRITVKRTNVPLPNDGTGIPTELTVTLREPLGNRTVIDASDGEVVRQTRCLPPLSLAPGCVVEANTR